MSESKIEKNLRILVIDDNRAIHEDFRKILASHQSSGSALDDLEASLFETETKATKLPAYEIDSAYQGQEGFTLVEQSLRDGRPYAMAFVDIRMPPGWDGLETAQKLWKICPDLQIVICTAYSDYSWDEMAAKLGNLDQLLILKKPFDAVEAQQLANALTEKWALHQRARMRMDELENAVRERTLALEQINSRLQEQAMLLDLAHDAIFVRDLEGRVQFWNKGAELLYGWSAAEAIGTKVSQLFPQGDSTTYDVREKALLATGEWAGEIQQQSKELIDIVANSRWTLVRDGQGNPHSILVINTDITEKKKLEAQFLRSQRMEGIGTLATGMAHDLNNILAPILMSAGALRWGLNTDESELAITRIEMSVKRAADVIQQVLTFGRGVTGERVAVGPADLIGEVSKIMGQTFPKDVVVNTDAPADLWTIMGDRTQIHQVLLNLCINARDSMPNGGHLSLRSENFTADQAFAAKHPPLLPGPYVMMQVTDTGCGIPKANLEKIFDPFFTTKELGKGTGLGLSTVLGIVKSHRGLVTVESEVGVGTTFNLLLPASPEKARRNSSDHSGVLPRGRGEEILLVDDEVSIVSAARRMLEKFGYRVLVANNGNGALALFEEAGHDVKLVVTDIMMPIMDGVALIKSLRKMNPEIKIIACSGLGRELGGGTRAAELACLDNSAFLAKPYSPEKLLTTLRSLLDGTPWGESTLCSAGAA